MKKRVVIVLLTGLVSASLAGCGTKADATDQSSESSVVESEADDSVTDESKDTGEAGGEESAEKGSVNDAVEHEYFYALQSFDTSNAVEIDVNALKITDETYDLHNSVDIYSSKGVNIGYTKEDITVEVKRNDDEWYQIFFENEEGVYQFVFVKADEFLNATTTEKPEMILTTFESVKDEFASILDKIMDDEMTFQILDSPTEDMDSIEFKVPLYCDGSDMLNLNSWIEQAIVKNNITAYSIFYLESMENQVDDEYLWIKVYLKKPQEEKDLNLSTVPKEESKNSNITVPETHEADNLPAKESTQTDQISDKYTPEEAVAVYRSLMEAGGITWNPALKDVSSWGTGWIYLDKGQPEWCAETSLESYAMGDSVGNSWTQFYFEVTGSDENCVYVTEWHN